MGIFVDTRVAGETIGLVEMFTEVIVLIITFSGSFQVGLGGLGDGRKPCLGRPYLFWGD